MVKRTNNKKLKVGIVGSGFISDTHVRSIKMLNNAEVLACASRHEENVKEFAKKNDIPYYFSDYKKMLEMDDIDVVSLGVPNDLHLQMVLDASSAGKHIICEKPLCLNFEEAELMINSCKMSGVKLMYVEQCCFAPRYIKLKELCKTGALGKIYFIKHMQKHDGPHSGWFWDIERTGGGVVMDMGCHAFGFFRWLTDNAEIESVYADLGTYMHSDKTKAEDNAIIIIKFKNGIIAISEVSWAKKGGYDDRAEVYGLKGISFANMSSSLKTYSEVGFKYVSEKAPISIGWSFPVFEEDWQSGFPQMFSHFFDCIINDKEPMFSGEDGRVVLEMVFASYESAKKGKKIKFPFKTDVKKPIDLWLS